MVSANALVFENRAKKGGAKSLLLTQKSPFESPYLVQISGENVAHIQEAVEILNEIDGVDGIDLNCGCPVPKVVKQGAGSALLQTPKTLCEIIETIKKHSKKRYTSLKIRLGFNEKTSPRSSKTSKTPGRTLSPSTDARVRKVTAAWRTTRRS